MYRKKLMRVALAGIMTATVITSSVPVNAADVQAAAQQEEAKKPHKPEKETRDINLVYYNAKNGENVANVPLTVGKKDTQVHVENVKKYVPEGWELAFIKAVDISDKGIARIAVTEKPVETKEVRIVYFDSVTFENLKAVNLTVGKLDEEVHVENLRANLPEGYHLVKEAGVAIDANGTVKVAVSNNNEAETREINLVYFNAKNGENIANVPLTVGGKDTQVHVENVKKYVPEGWELAFIKAADIDEKGIARIAVTKKPVETKEVHLVYFNVENDENIGDAVITVGALDKEVHVENVRKHVPDGWRLAREFGFGIDENNNVKIPVKPDGQEVHLIYFDPTTGENISDKVLTVGPHDKDVHVENARKYVPAGWELVEEKGFPIDKNGNVKIAIKKAVREAVLTITFETTDGKVVGKETVRATGKDGEDATFKLGKDFEIPAGYKLSNDREQITEISIPYGSVGGHTMVVEEAAKETKEVHLIYFNVENDENISDAVITVGALDKEVHVENVRKHVPDGWRLAREFGFGIDENNNVKIPVKPDGQEVHLIYYNVENNENISDKVLTVGPHDTEVHIENVKKYLPEGWVLSKEGDPFVIDANGNVKIGIVKDVEASKDINIIYYDHKTKENYRNVVVSVDKDATEMEAAYVRRNLPEGYVIVDEDGRFPIEVDGTTRVAVAKATDWTPIEPAEPVEKPEKPEEPSKPGKEENKDDNKKDDKKDDKKDNKKKAPKTSDEANPLAAAVPAGLSLAAILALLVKKFK